MVSHYCHVRGCTNPVKWIGLRGLTWVWACDEHKDSLDDPIEWDESMDDGR
jgi:hypothetical protein